MEAIICDTSAFLFWRTPPIVRLLAAAPLDDSMLRDLLPTDRVKRFREELAKSSLLVSAARNRCLRRAHYGPGAQALKESGSLLAPSMDGPIDLLVSEKAQRTHSYLERSRLWNGADFSQTLMYVTEEVGVVCPAHALQQLSSRLSLCRTVMLASELCGSFAVYASPEPVRALLQELADANLIPSYSRWSCTLDSEGRLTNLWSRPPLATPDDLRVFTAESGTNRGRAKMLGAAELVVPGAASPFEVQMGILMGFSEKLGGEGYGGFEHNRTISLSPPARRLARRGSCVCDLYWEAKPGSSRRGFDLECHSVQHHMGKGASLSDAYRSAALQLVGVDVVEATYAQMAQASRFGTLSMLVAQKIGREYHDKTAREFEAAQRLRRELLVDWQSLPRV